jgi:hypothetical protein
LGRIWYDAAKNIIYRHMTPLTGLSKQEEPALKFSLENPEVKLTHDDLMLRIWPDEFTSADVPDEDRLAEDKIFRVAISITKKPSPADRVGAFLWLNSRGNRRALEGASGSLRWWAGCSRWSAASISGDFPREIAVSAQ